MNLLWFRGICIAAAIFLAVYVFLEAEPSPDPFILLVPPWDKVVHFLYYGTMAVLLGHGVGSRWLWLPLLLVPLIGGLDEWNQGRFPGRDSSIYDWFADLLGTAVLVAVYWHATKGASRGVVEGDHSE